LAGNSPARVVFLLFGRDDDEFEGGKIFEKGGFHAMQAELGLV